MRWQLWDCAVLASSWLVPMRASMIPWLHTAGFCCFGSGHVEVVQCLLEAGADKTHVTGSSPLHGACQGGHRQITQCLLEAGADASKADVQGNTPLSLAVSLGHWTVVRCLLEAGVAPALPSHCHAWSWWAMIAVHS